ncbi:hypothetical protein, partial [Serratia marcescens]|uniref:hypothetical protein n=1 Tax=Serratia marcescens TaxID=615 RepID=UPI001C37A339
MQIVDNVRIVHAGCGVNALSGLRSARYSRPDKTRQASHPAMSAQFWNRASIKQKIPVTIVYILLFSVFLRLFFRHTDKFIRCQSGNGCYHIANLST